MVTDSEREELRLVHDRGRGNVDKDFGNSSSTHVMLPGRHKPNGFFSFTENVRGETPAAGAGAAPTSQFAYCEQNKELHEYWNRSRDRLFAQLAQHNHNASFTDNPRKYVAKDHKSAEELQERGKSNLGSEFEDKSNIKKIYYGPVSEGTFRLLDDSGAFCTGVRPELVQLLSMYEEYIRPVYHGTASDASGLKIYGHGLICGTFLGLSRGVSVFCCVGEFNINLLATIQLFRWTGVAVLAPLGRVLDTITGEETEHDLRTDTAAFVDFQVKFSTDKVADDTVTAVHSVHSVFWRGKKSPSWPDIVCTSFHSEQGDLLETRTESALFRSLPSSAQWKDIHTVRYATISGNELLTALVDHHASYNPLRHHAEDMRVDIEPEVQLDITEDNEDNRGKVAQRQRKKRKRVQPLQKAFDQQDHSRRGHTPRDLRNCPWCQIGFLTRVARQGQADITYGYSIDRLIPIRFSNGVWGQILCFLVSVDFATDRGLSWEGYSCYVIIADHSINARGVFVYGCDGKTAVNAAKAIRAAKKYFRTSPTLWHSDEDKALPLSGEATKAIMDTELYDTNPAGAKPSWATSMPHSMSGGVGSAEILNLDRSARILKAECNYPDEMWWRAIKWSNATMERTRDRRGNISIEAYNPGYNRDRNGSWLVFWSFVDGLPNQSKSSFKSATKSGGAPRTVRGFWVGLSDGGAHEVACKGFLEEKLGLVDTSDEEFLGNDTRSGWSIVECSNVVVLADPALTERVIAPEVVETFADGNYSEYEPEVELVLKGYKKIPNGETITLPGYTGPTCSNWGTAIVIILESNKINDDLRVLLGYQLGGTLCATFPHIVEGDCNIVREASSLRDRANAALKCAELVLKDGSNIIRLGEVSTANGAKMVRFEMVGVLNDETVGTPYHKPPGLGGRCPKFVESYPANASEVVDAGPLVATFLSDSSMVSAAKSMRFTSNNSGSASSNSYSLLQFAHSENNNPETVMLPSYALTDDSARMLTHLGAQVRQLLKGGLKIWAVTKVPESLLSVSSGLWLGDPERALMPGSGARFLGLVPTREEGFHTILLPHHNLRTEVLVVNKHVFGSVDYDPNYNNTQFDLHFIDEGCEDHEDLTKFPPRHLTTEELQLLEEQATFFLNVMKNSTGEMLGDEEEACMKELNSLDEVGCLEDCTEEDIREYGDCPVAWGGLMLKRKKKEDGSKFTKARGLVYSDRVPESTDEVTSGCYAFRGAACTPSTTGVNCVISTIGARGDPLKSVDERHCFMKYCFAFKRESFRYLNKNRRYFHVRFKLPSGVVKRKKSKRYLNGWKMGPRRYEDRKNDAKNGGWAKHGMQSCQCDGAIWVGPIRAPTTIQRNNLLSDVGKEVLSKLEEEAGVPLGQTHSDFTPDMSPCDSSNRALFLGWVDDITGGGRDTPSSYCDYLSNEEEFSAGLSVIFYIVLETADGEIYIRVVVFEWAGLEIVLVSGLCLSFISQLQYHQNLKVTADALGCTKYGNRCNPLPDNVYEQKVDARNEEHDEAERKLRWRLTGNCMYICKSADHLLHALNVSSSGPPTRTNRELQEMLLGWIVRRSYVKSLSQVCYWDSLESNYDADEKPPVAYWRNVLRTCVDSSKDTGATSTVTQWNGSNLMTTCRSLAGEEAIDGESAAVAEGLDDMQHVAQFLKETGQFDQDRDCEILQTDADAIGKTNASRGNMKKTRKWRHKEFRSRKQLQRRVLDGNMRAICRVKGIINPANVNTKAESFGAKENGDTNILGLGISLFKEGGEDYPDNVQSVADWYGAHFLRLLDDHVTRAYLNRPLGFEVLAACRWDRASAESAAVQAEAAEHPTRTVHRVRLTERLDTVRQRDQNLLSGGAWSPPASEILGGVRGCRF